MLIGFYKTCYRENGHNYEHQLHSSMYGKIGQLINCVIKT